MASQYLQINSVFDVGGGNTAVNVFKVHADTPGSWTGANRTTIANLFITDIKAFYQTLVPLGLRYPWTIGTSVIEYQTGQPPTYVPTTPQVTTSTSSGAIPLQLASVIAWRTALAGRSYRGRTFLGPLSTPATTGTSVLQGAFVTGVNAAVVTLLAAAVHSGFKLCVHSPTLDTTTTITSGTTDTVVDTLRSRAS